MNATFTVIKNISDHYAIQRKVSGEVWPEFMYHDPIANANWGKLFDWFAPYQISLLNGEEVVAIANSMPYYWDQPVEMLPDEGWDWAILKGIEDYEKGRKPNALNGLQIAVNKNYLGQGVSSLMVKEMRKAAEENGLKHVSLPVRPNMKDRYPLTHIDNYMNWTNEDGLPFDSWLRVHVKLGGKIIKSCKNAMYIPGTVKDWEEWTGLRFVESGQYVVQGALSPVKIDVEKDHGLYVEPNVWIVHELL